MVEVNPDGLDTVLWMTLFGAVGCAVYFLVYDTPYSHNDIAPKDGISTTVTGTKKKGGSKRKKQPSQQSQQKVQKTTASTSQSNKTVTKPVEKVATKGHHVSFSDISGVGEAMTLAEQAASEYLNVEKKSRKKKAKAKATKKESTESNVTVSTPPAPVVTPEKPETIEKDKEVTTSKVVETIKSSKPSCIAVVPHSHPVVETKALPIQTSDTVDRVIAPHVIEEVKDKVDNVVSEASLEGALARADANKRKADANQKYLKVYLQNLKKEAEAKAAVANKAEEDRYSLNKTGFEPIIGHKYDQIIDAVSTPKKHPGVIGKAIQKKTSDGAPAQEQALGEVVPVFDESLAAKEKAEADAAKTKADADAAKKKADAAALAKKKVEEDAAKAAKQKADDAAASKKKAAAAALAKKKTEEEAAAKKEKEAKAAAIAKKKAEVEAAAAKKEKEAKAAAEEATKKKAEEEAAAKKEMETKAAAAALAKKKAEEEAAAKKEKEAKAAAEEAVTKKAEEEAAAALAKKKTEEAAKKKAEEEAAAAKKEKEAKAVAEEAAKKEAATALAKKKAEEASKKKAMADPKLGDETEVAPLPQRRSAAQREAAKRESASKEPVSTEQTSVLQVSEDERKPFCTVCLKNDVSLMKCGSCGAVSYCGRFVTVQDINVLVTLFIFVD